jgi:choline monooxygenase
MVPSHLSNEQRVVTMDSGENLHRMVMAGAYTSEEWCRSEQTPRQLLPVETYTTERWFRREQRELFGLTWLFAGMVEDLQYPGDYAALQNGGPPIFVLRDKEGRLRAFHNVCRHRGARLVESTGNFGRAIICFYHNWTYELSGELKSVTLERELFPELDKTCHGLHPAKVATWKNLVFVHPDPATALPFQDWLADVPQKLGPFEPGQSRVHDPERLVEVSNVIYRVRANWKIVAENFIDGYHLPLLHPISLGDGDFLRQKWQPAGRHQAFYRPLKPGITHDKQPLPVVEGVPATFGAAYQWLYPSLALYQTATSWSTFQVIPLAPDLSLLHIRTRAMPSKDEKAKDDKAAAPVPAMTDLPDYIVGAKGRLAREQIGKTDGHPLKSNDFMREDIYACEAIQNAMSSPHFSVGPLSKWEAPLTFLQRQILEDVPLRP